jgi:GH25 family lysozyme M1 (1,4-beta-N-acetylmuramidase)
VTRLCAIAAAVAALAFPAGAGAYVRGFDVSRYVGYVPWPRAASAGYRFAYAEATYGNVGTDSSYLSHRSGAASAALAFGAFHFARPAGRARAAAVKDAVSEADHFVAAADVAAGDLPPALDLERTYGLRPSLMLAWTQAWLAEVQAKIGVRAVIYTSPNFWSHSLADTAQFAAAGSPLWLARWTPFPAPPWVPAGNWNARGWTFWQWTDCGRIPGRRRCFDLDRFKGSTLVPTLLPLPPVNTSPPEIAGTAAVGQVLSATPGNWEATPAPSFAFQWRRCSASCVSVPGATRATYTVRGSDTGASLSVVVTATSRGRSATAASAATAVVG